MYPCPHCDSQLSSFKALAKHMRKPPQKCQAAMLKRNISDPDSDYEILEPSFIIPRSSTKHYNSEIQIVPESNKIIYDKYIAEGTELIWNNSYLI